MYFSVLADIEGGLYLHANSCDAAMIVLIGSVVMQGDTGTHEPPHFMYESATDNYQCQQQR
jgi:hypothetical protein